MFKAPYHIEKLDLDGSGVRRCSVYPMPAGADYWSAVTDVPCPMRLCRGRMRNADAVELGYRVCDSCHRHFLAAGNPEKPTLIRYHYRMGKYVAL